MLVHAPIACWLLIPFCDLAALSVAADFLHQVAALLAALGAAGGALAATAGALDFERGHKAAPSFAIAHASLMGVAFVLGLASLLGRVDAHNMHVLMPPPVWAIAASALGLVVMTAGAACGGELVYGRGVGVKQKSTE
jgi:uncharacterized membrane protein